MCNMREPEREKERNVAKEVRINECERFLEPQHFEPGNKVHMCACLHMGADFLL